MENIIRPIGVISPFTYTLDKDIAINAPDINLSVARQCTNVQGTTNCAEYELDGAGENELTSNDYSYGAIFLTQIQEIHSLGVATDHKQANDIDLVDFEIPISIRRDNRIEANETVSFGASKSGQLGASFIGTLDFTNDALDAGNSNVLVSYDITNDDQLDLTISDDLTTEANPGDQCVMTESATEVTCTFSITGTGMDFDSDVADLMVLNFNHVPGDVAIVDTLSNSTITDPKDYVAQWEGSDLTFVANKADLAITPTPLDGEDKFSQTLSLTIKDDDFVEPLETLSAFISIPDDSPYINSFSDAHSDGNSDWTDSSNYFNREIPIDDTLSLTINKTIDTIESSVAGNGDDEVSQPYSIIWANNPIAENTPTIELAITEDSCPINSDCASVSDGDFTLANLVIHDATASEYTAIPNPTGDGIRGGLTIQPDNIIEVNELAKLAVNWTSSSDYIGSISNGTGTPGFAQPDVDVASATLDYTIFNIEKAELSINKAASGSTSIAEDASSAVRTFDYQFFWSKSFSKEVVPEISFTITAGGTAAADVDFRHISIDSNKFNVAYASDTYTLTPKDQNSALASGNELFTVRVRTDNIVEKDETIIPVITAPDDTYLTVASSNPDSYTYTITNDDQIELALKFYTASNASTNVSSGNTLNADEGSGNSFAKKLNIEAIGTYTSEGLSDEDRTLTVSLTGNDATLNNANITLPENLTSGFNRDLISFNLDDIIELDDTVTATITNTAYMKGDFIDDSIANRMQPFSITLINDDYLVTEIVNTQHTPSKQPSQVQVSLCKPSDDSIEGGEITITTKLTQLTDFPLTCDDIEGSCTDDTVPNGDPKTMTGPSIVIAANELENIPNCSNDSPLIYDLFVLKPHSGNDIEANEWLSIELTTEDNRCESDVCLDDTDIVAFNGELTSTLDSGLTLCMKEGGDERWGVECGTEAAGYGLQDAATTDTSISDKIYPTLAYTYIDVDGNPSANNLYKDEHGVDLPVAPTVCVQDNNTGLIWSQSLEKGVYTDSPSITTCTIGGLRTWQLPTLDELQTILDIEKLVVQREFRFELEGSDIHNFTSRYWTSDLCTVDVVDDGRWTVDLTFAHVQCVKYLAGTPTEESAFILVNK